MCYKILIILFMLSLCFIFGMLSGGCTVIWTDDLFVGTLFKTVDANDLDIIAEPNYIQIGSGQTKTKNDKVKASVIISGVPVILETGDKNE